MPTKTQFIDAFKAADQDGNGDLTKTELISVLTASGISVSEADKLMEKLDLNGDGVITFGEYKLALGLSCQPLDVWQQLFSEIDKNNSGSVDYSELASFLRSSDCGELVETLDYWMEDFDVNKDGKLQYGEFLGFVASLD